MKVILFASCLLFFIASCVTISAVLNQTPKGQKPRVCIIGAGIAGLTAARYLKDEGINFAVFESTQYIGGTWRYDPRVGTDEYGLPIHSSVYQHLRTNLPKKTMELNGFPVPEEMPSFPTWKQYYAYILSYADHFDLKKHIQFLHAVTSVKREGKIWKVIHKYLPTGEVFQEEYDFVFVCSGHLRKPHLPNIPGENKFKGSIIHSHDFKEPTPYINRRLLVIGGGATGMDVALDLALVSNTLFHSHHVRAKLTTPFPPNYIKKPDVKELNETGALFVDETFEEFDDVIYCTGYEFDYPFLDETSGLTLTPRYILPLYYHIVNIYQPTMILTGLTSSACIVTAIDAQARYAAALVKGNFTLPPEEEMLKDWQSRVNAIHQRGRPLSDLHLLFMGEDNYYSELANQSRTLRVPPVLFKIRRADMMAKLANLYTYRNYEYTILDNSTFIQSYRDLPYSINNIN